MSLTLTPILHPLPHSSDWPAGTGPLATLIRAFNWSATDLGPFAHWPQSLKTAIDVMLQSPVPMVMLCGVKGIMIYNDSYADFAGNRHPHILGTPVLEGWHEVADFNQVVLDTCLAGRTLTFQNQHLILNRHGEPRDAWCDLYYSPLLDESGTPNGVLAIVVETTQRVQAEKQRQSMEHALHDSEQRYKLALEASELVGTWEWDLFNDLVVCDERFATLFQVDPQQAAIGVPIEQFLLSIHPDDLAMVQHHIENAIVHQHEFKSEYRLIQADGSIRWMNARGRCHYDAEGQPLRFPGVAIDITERKQIEFIIDGQKRALEQSVNGEPLHNVLETIIHTIETQSHNNVMSSIFLIADDGYRLQYGAAPNLTPSYIKAIEGIKIGPLSGSCGTAAFLREEVFVDDVMTNPIWSDFKDYASEQGFRSCWSMPLISSNGQLLGTFALYYPDVRRPSVEDRSIVQLLSHTAILVIERHSDNQIRMITEKHQAALLELGDRLRALETIDDITVTAMEIVGRTLDVTRTGYGVVDDTEQKVTIYHDWTDGTVASIVGHHQFDNYGAQLANSLKRGDILVVNDAMNDPVMAGGAEKLQKVHVAALINVPLIEDGRLAAIYYIHDSKPRIWTREEISFVRNVADRTWVAAEQALAEKELRDSEQHFRQLANAMPQVVWTARADGHMDYINDRSEVYSGPLPIRNGIINWAAIVYPEDLRSTIEAWTHCVKTGEKYEIHQRIYNKDTLEYRWNLTRALPVHDEQGHIVKWLGTNTDIEDQIRNTQALSEARDLAQQANIAKSEFLANMSHEIRTPMNAVIGLSNILSNSTPLTTRQKEFIHTLQLSADSLLALINDLLDISKIEARTVDLEQIPFSVENLMHEIISMMNVRVKEKNLNFLINTNNATGRFFIGDPARLRQIILNLCSNAIKFTEEGGVQIDVTCQPTDNPQIENIRIAVADTGIGIPEDKLKTIFDKFVQADSSINRKYGGTGLGLAITKTLTEIMGGTITLSSEPGKGSVFTVQLPMAITSEILSVTGHDTVSQTVDNPNQPLILLVEDYAPNVLVAGNYLEQFGYRYHVASNGLEAFEAIQNNKYHAVLMDVQMHGMNGFEATRMIRQFEKDNNLLHTLIIGMTAHALAGDRERCLAAGMDDYLSKPFNPAHLENLLNSMIDKE